MKTGFTFYHSGTDYFVPVQTTYRTKAVAERFLTGLGIPVTPERTEYVRKRMQKCTLEQRGIRNGNPMYIIHGNDFGIVDPEGKTVILN